MLRIELSRLAFKITVKTLAILFYTTVFSVWAERTADILSLPWRPFNAALGGQVSHSLFVESTAATNAAYLGYGQQNSFFFGTLLAAKAKGGFFDTTLFSPFGGLGLGVDYLEAGDMSAALRFSYGSFLTKHVATGLSLSPRYTTDSKNQAFGFGIDPALVIDSKWYKAFGKNDGLGIYSPAFSLTAQNLAIPLGENTLLPKSAVHVGFTSGIFQDSNLNIALALSTYGSDKFDRVPLLVGLESQYKWFLFSLGYSAYNTTPLRNGISLGVGGFWRFTFGDALFFYNLSIPKEKEELFHGVVASVRLGGVDSEPPEIEFAPEGTAFSPNDDGVRDVMLFSAKASDKSPIVYYELQIRDAKDKIVYQLKSDERLREKSFSFGLFFTSFISPRKRADIPTEFSWNGRIVSSGSKNVKDAVFEDEPQVEKLPDGIYHYEFWVIDEKNNESKHITGSIGLNTQKPVVGVEIDGDMLSPNGDGVHDTLTITQDVSAQDSYEAFILASNGEKVRHFIWKENAPTRIDFDGKKDNGDLLPEGVYRYQLLGYNTAGNRNEVISNNFYVSRRVDEIFLKSSVVGINPTQKKFATVELFPSVSYSEGFVSGAILVYKNCNNIKEENIVFKIPVLAPPAEEKPKKGNKKANKGKSVHWYWGGESLPSAHVPDGVYCLVFRAEYQNGNIPTSHPVQVIVDSTPPELNAVADLEVRQFTPDGDGENESQVFRLSSNDITRITSYTLEISEVLRSDTETKIFPVRTFKGEGDIPQSIYWDGRTENGSLVESLTYYQYTLTATDSYGNTTTTLPRLFQTGILVTPVANGFFIRITQINLSDPADERIRLLYNILDKYLKYKVKTEVHAAPSKGIEKNLRNTEKAARLVYEYLIAKGIAADRLSYQGFGDTIPIYKGAAVQKNNRIDIYLTR
ncbi:MAG: hypothetical protein LDLANPLL_00173 [Turneriella sp.]|nr:hypothetical protein [Turneriella sp.]